MTTKKSGGGMVEGAAGGGGRRQEEGEVGDDGLVEEEGVGGTLEGEGGGGRQRGGGDSEAGGETAKSQYLVCHFTRPDLLNEHEWKAFFKACKAIHKQYNCDLKYQRRMHKQSCYVPHYYSYNRCSLM